jgi:hypothetical protein
VFFVARSSFFTCATASIEPPNKRALNRIRFISDVVLSRGSIQRAPRPLPQGYTSATLDSVHLTATWRVLLSVVSRLIIAGAALIAITLAVFLWTGYFSGTNPPGMRMIFRVSLFAAILLGMAFMMISYHIRKFPH